VQCSHVVGGSFEIGELVGNRFVGSAAVVALLTFAACTTHPASQPTPTESASVSPSVLASPSPSRDPYAGWKVYRSQWEGATFRYPPAWSAKRQSFSSGYGNRSGDQVTFTSPRGFSVTWIAPVSGIGGGCDASKLPHIFIDRVLTMPSIKSQYPLRIIVASVQGHKTLAVVDATDLPNFKTGDTGDCLLYTFFRSRPPPHLLVGLYSGPSMELYGGHTEKDGTEQLTDTQYLLKPDVEIALMIFRSLRY
jgi:hypothetical protein